MAQQPKQFVEQAIGYYAAFFADLTAGANEQASHQLELIRETDKRAERELAEKGFEYYKNRRTYLMRLFRHRLCEELKGQVEEQLLAQVEKLVEDLEAAASTTRE